VEEKNGGPDGRFPSVFLKCKMCFCYNKNLLADTAGSPENDFETQSFYHPYGYPSVKKAVDQRSTKRKNMGKRAPTWFLCLSLEKTEKQ